MTQMFPAQHTHAFAVSDCMNLPSFFDASVLAGANNLSNVVTNAMVLESSDIEKWGREGLLLLTSLFALEPMTQTDRLLFLEKLAKIKIAGIVFKPKRLYQSPPAYLVDFCNRANIPLIQMSESITYERIITDVMSCIIDINSALLNNYYEMHRRTMHLTLEHPSIAEMLSTLKGLIRTDVTYYNRMSSSSITTLASAHHIKDIKLIRFDRGKFQTFDYFTGEIFEGNRIREIVLAVKIPDPIYPDTYLLIHKNPRVITQFNICAIENLASILQVTRLQEVRMEEFLAQKNNSAVQNLLYNHHATKEILNSALNDLHLNIHDYYQAIIIKLAIQGRKDQDQQNNLHTVAIHNIKQRHSNVVYYVTDSYVIMLRNCRDETHGFRISDIQDILESMAQNPTLPKFCYLVGMSSIVKCECIGLLAGEVHGIYTIYTRQELENQIIRFDDLGIYKMFLHEKDLSVVASYIDKRVLAIKQTRKDLFETLVAMQECNFSIADCASKLYLHQKTIRYRIKKILEDFNLDLSLMEDIVQVVISIHIIHILED